MITARNPSMTTRFRLRALLSAFTSLVLIAQTALGQTSATTTVSPKPEDKPAPTSPAVAPSEVLVEDELLVLTPYEVNTQKDVGFAATSSLAGGRLATDLKDTPASYSVVNKQMIDALGLTDLTQAAEWTTNTYKFADGAGGGDTFNITTPITVRGAGNISQLRQRNFFIYYSENDSYSIERFDFGRGPNQLLFGNGTVGGTQVTMTKRPRTDKEFGSVEVNYGSWANQRFVLDYNKPFLKGKAAIRVATLWADREGWRDNEMESKKAAFLTATFKPTKNTDLRIEGEMGQIDRRIPDAKLNERFAGWNGTYNANYLVSAPGNAGALGIDRRPGNYVIYNPASGSTELYHMTNWAMTRGAGDTTTTYAGDYLQVGTTSWNQSSATILNAVDVVPNRFDRALANSYFAMPGRTFTNAPSTPLITSQFKDIQATINQRVGSNLFLELAADVNSVENDINRFESDSITTYIDINPTLPGGAANPNYLRPYGDGRYWFTNKETNAKSVRLGVAYLLDLKKAGKYGFNFMSGLTHQVVKTRNRVLAPGIVSTTAPQFIDRRQWGNLDNALRQRIYWGDDRSYVLPPTTIKYNSSVVATGVATTGEAYPYWTPAIGGTDNTNNMNDAIADYNYVLGGVNAKYFKDRLVILAAMRYDSSEQVVHYLKRGGDFPDNWDGRTLVWRDDAPADWAALNATRPRQANAYGVQVANPAFLGNRYGDDYNPPAIKASVWTPSTGAVVHLSNWFSVFGNYAESIAFNSAAAPDVNGNLLPAIEAKGTDFGIRFMLFDKRLNISAVAYNNEEYGNYIDPTAVTNQINTLYDANVWGERGTGLRNHLNAMNISTVVRDTRTRITKGYEFELVANLTRSWRVTANAGLPQVTEKLTAPMTREYMNKNKNLFLQVLDGAGGEIGPDGKARVKTTLTDVNGNPTTDTNTNGDEATGHEALRAVIAYNNMYINAGNFVVNPRKGLGAPVTVNIFTDYEFREGWIKGFKIGAGVNYRGRRAVGYRNADTIASGPTTAIDDPSVDAYTPVYVPGYSLVTGTVGYKWKISRKYELTLNLRISNLFNEEDVIYTDGNLALRPKNGDFTSPARETVYAPYAYQTPRSYNLTARLSF